MGLRFLLLNKKKGQKMKSEKKREGKKWDVADVVLAVLVVLLVVGGLLWLKHKDEQARLYAERNHCEWQAVGGLSVCK